MNIDKITKKELEAIKNTRSVRRKLAYRNHLLFFIIYLSAHIRYKFAPFHKEMFELTQEKDSKTLIIVAFRGSGKSTIMSLSYPIWSIIGAPQKKFVLIVTQTQQQARLMLSNIKEELEGNELLKNDIGPFEESDEWGSLSIVIPKFNARITLVSTEQSIRGMKHGSHRPNLIICDDIENLDSVRTKEGRDKIYTWFNGEIIPIGDKDTKIVIVGNILHEDSLIVKLKKEIDRGTRDGIYRAYPLLDDDNNIAWQGKYPDMKDIEIEKKKIGNDSAWSREYLLKIISEKDQIVKREWIQYYDEIPLNLEEFRYISIGIDLAISQKESADYTAIVQARVYGYNENLKIYILPFPVNKRINFNETIETIKEIYFSNNIPKKLYIEDVGYQKATIQELNRFNVQAEGINVQGNDKRARLASITHMIQQEKILFPTKGGEDLIIQLTGFGIEKHDDLVDALTLLVIQEIENSRSGFAYGFI
ncbi:MAG: phage terminase large subunit family protein [Patescibacteria group bacterium]